MLNADPEMKKCIVAESPEGLINLLLDIDLSTEEIRSCPYYTALDGKSYMIRVNEIPNEPTIREQIQISIARKKSLAYGDLSRFHGVPSGEVGHGLVDKLAPHLKDLARPYSALLFWCKNEDFFTEVLDVLFKLRVKNIEAARLQVGNEIIHLIQASGITSPIVLSKFSCLNDVKLLYPIGVSLEFNKIWIEWGWQYNLSSYNILQPDDSKVLFVFGSGEKVLAKRPSFLRLLEFIKLKFESGTQTRPGEPRDFDEGEYDYILQLRPAWKTWGKKEIDDLRQQEREIRERINWLEGIDSIFDRQSTHRVLFYPFGSKEREPNFPRYFFRSHSLYQLRQFKFYYGDLGPLGEGVLVGSKNFIDNFEKQGLEIASRFYPRNGWVFETAFDWLAAANLRVLIPEGFNLFPYLEIDEGDTARIVEAFLKTVVRFDSVVNRHVRLDPKKVENILSHPRDYLFFIFPKGEALIQSAEKSALEGLVLHKSDFCDFDIKLANLGINFAKTDEERNAVNQNFRTTIVQNFASQYDVSIGILRSHLEDSFQEERKRLKEKIDGFIEFTDNTEKALAERREKIDQTIKDINIKESIVSGYKDYLETIIEGYTSLCQTDSPSIEDFGRQIDLVLKELNRDTDTIFSDNADRFTQKIKFLREVQERSGKTQENMKAMLEKKEASLKALNELKELDKLFSSEISSVHLDSLEIRDNIQTTWSIDHTFRALSDHLSVLEDHLSNITGKMYRGETYAVTHDEDDLVKEWLEYINGRVNDIKSMKAQIKNGNSTTLKNILQKSQGPVAQCFQDLENSVRLLNEWKVRHRRQRELYVSLSKHIATLRKQIKSLTYSI